MKLFLSQQFAPLEEWARGPPLGLVSTVLWWRWWNGRYRQFCPRCGADRLQRKYPASFTEIRERKYSLRILYLNIRKYIHSDNIIIIIYYLPTDGWQDHVTTLFSLENKYKCWIKLKIWKLLLDKVYYVIIYDWGMFNPYKKKLI